MGYGNLLSGLSSNRHLEKTTVCRPSAEATVLQELARLNQGVSKQGVMTFAWRPGSPRTMSPRREVPTVYWQAIVARNLVFLQQGEDVAFA